MQFLNPSARPAELRKLKGSLRGTGSPFCEELARDFPKERLGWWDDLDAAREYWDVELTEQGIYRIFRDPETGSWYADGVYD